MLRRLRRLSAWLFGLLAIPALISCLLTLAGWWGPAAWPWDVANHFAPCYFTLQALALLCWMFGELPQTARWVVWIWRGLGLILLGCLALNGSRIAPFYWSPYPADGLDIRHAAVSASEKPLKILHINVLGPSRNSEAVARLIRQTRPDILTLAEYNGWWQNALKRSGALDGFTSRYVVPYGNDGVYSRIPFRDVHTEFMATGRDPTTIVHFSLQGSPVTLLVVHPRPPLKPDWYARHQKHFARWERDFPRYGPNVLMVGDLNSSPWGAPFRHFIAASGLRDTQLGYGVQPTWPTFWPSPWLRLPVPLIPIDHVLISRQFTVISQKTGHFVGSDHLPVVVELGFQASQTPNSQAFRAVILGNKRLENKQKETKRNIQ